MCCSSHGETSSHHPPHTIHHPHCQQLHISRWLYIERATAASVRCCQIRGDGTPELLSPCERNISYYFVISFLSELLKICGRKPCSPWADNLGVCRFPLLMSPSSPSTFQIHHQKIIWTRSFFGLLFRVLWKLSNHKLKLNNKRIKMTKMFMKTAVVCAALIGKFCMITSSLVLC